MLEGALGCPNCRDRYPIRRGFGDLRPPPRTDLPVEAEVRAPDSPTPVELAASLGITDGVGHVALLGTMAWHATALAEQLDFVEVVGVAPGLRSWCEGGGVSRLAAGSELPFRARSLRGAALFGEEAPCRPADVARVVARLGRVVAWGGVDGWDSALEVAGMRVLVSEATVVVAARP